MGPLCTNHSREEIAMFSNIAELVSALFLPRAKLDRRILSPSARRCAFLGALLLSGGCGAPSLEEPIDDHSEEVEPTGANSQELATPPSTQSSSTVGPAPGASSS